jgi:hypothetical protein
MLTKEVWAKLGNFSIMWVKENPTHRRTSMLTCIIIPIEVALSIPEPSTRVVYNQIGTDQGDP